MIENVYKESIKNSVGVSPKVPFKRRMKKVLASTGVILLAITSGVGLCSCKSLDKYDIGAHQQAVNKSIIASEILVKHGYTPRASLTVEQYATIPEIYDEDNLLPFFELQGPQEMDKIVSILGYDNLDDYLIKHGYIDDNGKPSYLIWETEYIHEKTK